MDNTKSIALINKYRGQIMGFSAICIVFFHLWECQLSPSSPLRLLYWLEHCISGMGYFGVDIFFLLSGIGLSYAIGKYGLKEFWLRRFRRLVVPVLVVSLIQWAKEGWTVLYYLFGLSGIGFFIKRHYFLWFISAITATYLLFPLYWRFFSRSRAKPRFTALFAAVWYLCSIPLAGVLKPIVFLFINRVPSFVLGVLLGWQQQNGGLKLSRRAVNTAAAVSAAAGLILGALCTFGETAFFQSPYNSTFPGVLIAFGFTVLLAELGGLLDRGGRAARGVNGFFGFYGRISLEIYCVQEFLGPIAADAARGLGCGSMAVNLIQLAAVTLSAWLLHILTDRVLALTGRLKPRVKCAG